MDGDAFLTKGQGHTGPLLGFIRVLQAHDCLHPPPLTHPALSQDGPALYQTFAVRVSPLLRVRLH